MKMALVKNCKQVLPGVFLITTARDRILYLLKSRYQEFVSGEEICRELDISRAAVWKHIKALRESGYGIDARPNSGYKIFEVPDRLYAGEIKYRLGTTVLGRKVIYYDTVASTNDVAKKLAAEGCPEGTVVVAEEQTEGRGRLGRKWFSPRGKNVMFSVLLNPTVNLVQLPQLTMLAAVAVAGAVCALTGLKAGIKWPNDLLLNEKKVCGILSEMYAEVNRVNYLVIGVGMNVNVDEEEFPPDIGTTATSLKIAAGEKINRAGLLQEILRQLERYYLDWQQHGFAPVLEEWKKSSINLGRRVRVISSGEVWEGICEDVDSDGALLLRLPGGSVKRFVAGEVSLRF